MARALGRQSRGPLTATFAAALGLALVGSAIPALAAVGVLVALAGVLLTRGAARLRAMLIALLPIALLGPWVQDLVADPRLLLAGPGAVADPLPVSQLAGLRVWSAWTSVLTLHPGWPAWTIALWLVPLGLVALASLARGGPRGRVVTALGGVLLLGLVLAVLAPAVTVSRPGEVPLTGWTGSGALVGLLALVAAPLVAADGL